MSEDVVVLFGQHTGKMDPRFPVQITVAKNGESENYISMQEHTAIIAEALKREAALREALEKYKHISIEGGVSQFSHAAQALAANPLK